MQTKDVRTTTRRIEKTRRVTDRRTNPYPFGSAEWVENMQRNYHAWPKSDRRVACRRSSDRRKQDRRRFAAESWLAGGKLSKPLLTREELQMIEDIYHMDDNVQR